MRHPKLMPGMTLDQQIRGTRSAIKALRTRRSGPTWLVPSLQERLRTLLKEKRQRHASA
jgi:hypothetical protein